MAIFLSIIEEEEKEEKSGRGGRGEERRMWMTRRTKRRRKTTTTSDEDGAKHTERKTSTKKTRKSLKLKRGKETGVATKRQRQQQQELERQRLQQQELERQRQEQLLDFDDDDQCYGCIQENDGETAIADAYCFVTKQFQRDAEATALRDRKEVLGK